MGATSSQQFVAGVVPFEKYSTPEEAIKDLEKVYESGGFDEFKNTDLDESKNAIRKKFADAAAAQEKFNQRMRKVDLTRSAVQRRAFFESEQTTSGAMRSTTGIA